MTTHAINSALEQGGFAARVRVVTPLSGGCIHRVVAVTLDDGSKIVAKINVESRLGLFEEEARGLESLAGTQTVLVPRPLVAAAAHGSAIFLMEAIETANVSTRAWQRLGEELAALHRRDAGRRYGFEIENHLGTTPQPNSWCDDWVEFNAEHRLGHQVRLARQAGLLDKCGFALIERVIHRLQDLIPCKPKPALLHGDLWSGNALPARDHDGTERIALIDPAPYVGDGWADIAMMTLFGGFPREVFEEYRRFVIDLENIETRLAVYQLYHVLNHLNIFGSGYAGQAISLARSLV